jgi:hypothetical protein
MVAKPFFSLAGTTLSWYLMVAKPFLSLAGTTLSWYLMVAELPDDVSGGGTVVLQ